MKAAFVYVLIFATACFSAVKAQPVFHNRHVGVSLGLVSSFGTHFHRFGLSLQGYYLYKFAQVNAQLRLYNNFRSLGPPGEYAEATATLGLVLAYGNRHHEYNRFMSPVSNQTRYNNSVGYSYTFWFNRIGTAQQTGIIALQFGRFSLISENDLFAKPILDRFRTGAVLLQYQDRHIQYGLNCTLWTGKMGRQIKGNPHFPNGYIDTTGGVYTQYSHGLLSAQVKYADPYGQILQANAGIDAEQVRNVLQNKLIHDLAFIPRKWYTPINSHIPMLDTAGHQYLYLPGQKIKKAKPYVNFHTAPAVFY